MLILQLFLVSTKKHPPLPPPPPCRAISLTSCKVKFLQRQMKALCVILSLCVSLCVCKCLCLCLSLSVCVRACVRARIYVGGWGEGLWSRTIQNRVSGTTIIATEAKIKEREG